MTEALYVSLHGHLVGRLVRHAEGSAFELDPSYLELPDRPILGQIFEEEPGRAFRARQGVPAWFANLLPEGPLRALIASRADVHETREYFLLALLGQDLPGAALVRAEGDLPAPDPDEPETPPAPDAPLKFSLAGVQLKFSAKKARRGLTIPAEGLGGDWIVKLPDQRYPLVPENEYFMMGWASRANIDVPELALVSASDIGGLPAEAPVPAGAAFAVQRFDRTNQGRVHIEDFAQVLDLRPSQKYGHANYETIGRIVHATADAHSVDQLLRRIVFSIVIGNGDAHLKNWSLIYPDGRTAQLAPAYDLISTVVYIPGDDLGLNFARTRRFDAIGRTSFGAFAHRVGLPEASTMAAVDRAVHEIVGAWEEVRELDGFPGDFRSRLDERLMSLPLVQGVRKSSSANGG